MKIGDKLMCKKNMFYDNGHIRFEQNKLYEITSSVNGSISLNKNMFFYTFYPNANEYKLCDYFYTIEELRKLKLKSL